jgi:hypothetical protein
MATKHNVRATFGINGPFGILRLKEREDQDLYMAVKIGTLCLDWPWRPDAELTLPRM